VVASVAPHHSVLPVPDASAFEPDAVASQDITDVHWPAQAEAKRPSPAKSQVLAPRVGSRGSVEARLRALGLFAIAIT
jgi:hypothetical protein